MRQFVKAAKSGSAVSPVQHAAKPTPGVPPSLIAQIDHIAHEVFASGYVTAMHLTIIMPVAVIAIAGVSCLAIKRDTNRARPVPVESAPMPEASQATA